MSLIATPAIRSGHPVVLDLISEFQDKTAVSQNFLGGYITSRCSARN